MTAVTVRVTAEHIGAGVAHDCRKCPVALALLDVLAVHALTVDQLSIWLYRGEEDYGVQIGAPNSAISFMNAFDSCRPVKPFEFTIDVPDDLIRQAVSAGG